MWPGMGMMPPGPGMGMAPPGMGMPAMMPPAMKSAEQREPYTVFVSKIGDINDTVMMRLLSLCGAVLSWKRPKDTAGKVKGFGVCEYEGPEATMRAMRLLAGLQVDKFTVMLKLSADMEKKVQEYRSRAEAMQAQPGFETPADRMMRDQNIRQQVLRAAAEYTSAQNAARAAAAAPVAAPPAAAAPTPAAAPPAVAAAAAAATAAMASVSDASTTAPAPAPSGATPTPASQAQQPEVSQAEQFLGGILGSSSGAPAPDGHVPGTNLIVKKQGSRSPSPSQPKHESDRRRDGGRGSRREQEEERMKEREFRERERRWEDRERQLARERERDKERLSREVDRAIDAGDRGEQTLLEEDEDVEDMRRGALEDRQRRRKVRRRLREQELRDDAEDERRERAEEEQAKRQADQAAADKQAPAKRSPERRAESRAQHQSSAAAGPMMMGPVGPVGPSGPAGPTGPAGPSMPGGSSPQAASGPSISMKTVAKSKVEPKIDKKPKNAAFAVEEETGGTKRKLVKLDYQADEAPGGAAQAARSAAAAAAMMINQRRGKGGESAADRAKRLIASVPKDKKDLYALPVDWAVLEQSSTIEKKMQPWIAKKVTEYFGETDETVISFVMEELEKHSSASDMIENLGPILEDDCGDFVFKMWRMLIYEMLDQQDQTQSA